MSLPKKILEERFRRFVEEDIGHGDITTFYTIQPETFVEAEVIAKEKGIAAGIEEALIFTETFGLQATASVDDGLALSPKTRMLLVKGDAATLLSVERTLLNLLSRMSGIATVTHNLVEKIHQAGYKTIVACTRKTVPGMLHFDKKAVMVGGGDSHRAGLDDMVLIKDNHLAVIGSIKEAVRNVREKASFSKKIEVEVARVDDVLEAAKVNVDIVMLDNFTPKQAKAAVDLLKKNEFRNKALLEASGNITEQNILEYAAAGVDIVSIGAITQSVKALDISLEITKVTNRNSKQRK